MKSKVHLKNQDEAKLIDVSNKLNPGRIFRGLLIPAVFLFFALTAFATDNSHKSPSVESKPVKIESTLKYLTAKSILDKNKFEAGSHGELELSFIISEKSKNINEDLTWNSNGNPLILRINAPLESGVTFGIDKNTKRPISEAVIEVKVPEGDASVTALIPYDVSSRVRVKHYNLRTYISAELQGSSGSQFQDSGMLDLKIKVETPLGTKVLVLIIISIAIFLFVVEWVRVDVVGILMMVTLPLLNLLSSKSTFTGLSSNAVVAIIGVMMVSAGLNKVGLVSRIVKPVIRAAGKSGSRLMIFLSTLIAIISSVMQNTGAAVLFLPGIRHACKQIKIPISSILMPIGMCAILGGTMTMIGTSPLILLNDILPSGMEKFGLLELTPIGVGFVIAGILYFSIVGRFFLKKINKDQVKHNKASQSPETIDVLSMYHHLDGPYELIVPKDFILPKNLPETVVQIRRTYLVNIVSINDDRGLKELAPPPDKKIRPGFSLCVYGPEEAVKNFVKLYSLELLSVPKHFKELFNKSVAGIVEAMVSPRSTMIGSTIREIGFRKTFEVSVLALFREGDAYYKEVSDIPLMAGDALLIYSTWEHFHLLQEMHHNFTIITPLEVEIQKPSKAKAAIFSFGIAFTLMLISSFYFQKLPYNPIPLSVCLMLGALLMVLTKVMSIKEAYAAVDWRTVFLLGGLIPLGMAVDQTGTAEWIATGIIAALGKSVTPLVLLVVLAVLSGAFCLVISNVGACTLLVPLGVSMAMQIGIDPRVAAIVVGLGVSNSFLLPTHQVNALYMGPGDYRTKDYMKVGGILSILYIVVLVSMTYLFYV